MSNNQLVARRTPRQERAHVKIGLIFEAATRLIEERGVDGLTTNAIAERAGISIGTLYQYFDGKGAILEALSRREMATMGARIKATLAAPAPREERGARIPALLQAVLSSYGGRRTAHRRLMEYMVTHGGAGMMNPFFAQIAGHLTGGEISSGDGAKVALSPAHAFVLTHALAGVMRGMLFSQGPKPPREDVELALTQLVLGFVGAGER